MSVNRSDDGTFKAKDKQKVAAGRIGGKVSGDSKARFGQANARFDPKADRRPCCGAHAKRSHKKTCPNHRTNKIMALNRGLRKQGVKNVPTHLGDEWLNTLGVINMIRGCQGICVTCGSNMPVKDSARVHKDDITSFTMRVICKDCT